MPPGAAAVWAWLGFCCESAVPSLDFVPEPACVDPVPSLPVVPDVPDALFDAEAEPVSLPALPFLSPLAALAPLDADCDALAFADAFEAEVFEPDCADCADCADWADCAACCCALTLC